MGLIVLIWIDSIILTSIEEFDLLSISKSSIEKGCLWVTECSLIVEWGGVEIGRPVLGETPLCSANLKVKFREVSPIYLHLHAGHLNPYTMLDCSAAEIRSLKGKKDFIV